MYKLRELERRDLPEINRWRNKKTIISSLGAPFRFINLEVDSKWFDSYMANRNSTVRCAITTDDSDQILGLVSLTNVDFLFQSATFHIMIGEESNQNKGIGTYAVTAMLEHAFSNMNLHRIELGVLASNERAIHLYEKVGFKREGVRRDSVYKNGVFQDMYLYAILKEEFFQNRFDYNRGGGVTKTLYLVPKYCINQIKTSCSIAYCIKECDNAFDEDYYNNDSFMEKIAISAEFVVAQNRTTLGYSAFYSNDSVSKTAYITLIAVRKEYQGQHIGQALLNAVINCCIAKSMKFINLEVQSNNAIAIAFYSKNGFQIIGDKTDHSYLMSKVLE